MGLLTDGLAGPGTKLTVTVMPSIVPPEVIAPEVLATPTPVTYLVVCVEEQVAYEIDPDCAISETQVRAALAASTISDTLALRV